MYKIYDYGVDFQRRPRRPRFKLLLIYPVVFLVLKRGTVTFLLILGITRLYISVMWFIIVYFSRDLTITKIQAGLGGRGQLGQTIMKKQGEEVAISVHNYLAPTYTPNNSVGHVDKYIIDLVQYCM